MAVSQTFAITESEDGTIIYITDETGEYDAVSNPNGYGAVTSAGAFDVGVVYTIISVGTTDFTLIGAGSNAIGVSFTATGVGTGTGTAGTVNKPRGNIALIILGKYKASTGNTDLTFDTYDPEIDTQFSVPDLDTDGYYQFLIYTVDRYVAQSPTLNTFVYDFTANQLQRGNGAAFVSATASELEDNDIANETKDWPHIPDLSRAKNYLNKLLLIGTQQSVKKTDLQQFLISTEVMYYGGIALFGEGSYTTFQEEIEKYQSRVDTILELT